MSLEWGFTWLLAKNEAGMVTKESVRRIYDGSLFYHIAEMRRAMKEGGAAGIKTGGGDKML